MGVIDIPLFEMPPSFWLPFNTDQLPLPCSEGRQNNCKLVANPHISIMS